MQVNPSRIVEMASRYFDSCVLFAASDIGVFDKLAELRAADADRLAAELKLNARGLKLLLNACVAEGLLEKAGDVYRNTPETATFLVQGMSGDLSGAIRYNRDVYGAWGKLVQLVRDGKPVEKPEEHLGYNLARTRTFVMAMHGRALGIGRAVVPLLDVATCRTLLDVGGGPGTYSVLLAQANPGLTCTVVDLPGVVKIARELIDQQRMTDRVKTLAGDYHCVDFPRDQDAVAFLGVLHQESPELIRGLMRKAFEALKPGGRLFVLDMMTDETHTAPRFSALFAVNMALTTDNGWVFSDAELREWMTGAGFRDAQMKPLPPPMPHWLVSARKPG